MPSVPATLRAAAVLIAASYATGPVTAVVSLEGRQNLRDGAEKSAARRQALSGCAVPPRSQRSEFCLWARS